MGSLEGIRWKAGGTGSMMENMIKYMVDSNQGRKILFGRGGKRPGAAAREHGGIGAAIIIVQGQSEAWWGRG